MNEKILVVPRKILFGENGERMFTGFVPIEERDFTEIINNNLVAKPRKEVEDDPSLKQIIPYSIFVHDKKIFTYKRTTKGGEPRLHDKYSIGIGGHMNPVDGKNPLIEGMKREFYEEMHYNDKFDAKIIGFVNEEKTPVDKVHFGVVFMLTGKTPQIYVAEKDKLVGGLLELPEIEEKRDCLEGWSRIAFDNIKSRLVA